jgi:hypothetical protein
MRSLYGLIAILSLAALSACSRNAVIPHLQKQGTATQLIVDGKPFLMLAGELRNSSGSILDYLKPIWPKLAAMHINTVLTAVYWDGLTGNGRVTLWVRLLVRRAGHLHIQGIGHCLERVAFDARPVR